ncbi:efflux RND transporter periplasmic adaptor subunit [Rhodomicrobium sp. Az07]|uniref:efflux RND transporter periplasmic adaptor subunit n=1 Tax=Rhodomicrobium sp. Az07 TaxID=2839034 RepID=UPI001BE939D0|nr:efflux RND transporter periplasmic adaptor subunit [Rhodomicrobium sp. Az07]MBT3069532.1 efflux RND transporter periplasmic adaptor subunit [Rhodomicrobium sp. Az07]
MKRLLPWLIFLLITAFLAIFVYSDRIFGPSERDGVGTAGGTPGGRFRRGDQAVSAETKPARLENVPVWLSGVGTVQAFNTATVRAQVSGRLIEVAYHEGQDVKAGDVLARIDPVLYQAAYDEAVAKKAQDEALLANARRDAARYSSLVGQNYTSQQQADTAKSQVQQYEAQVKQDQAAIDTARANLDYATIRAPIDGRTGIRQLDTGNLVTSGDSTGIVVITQLRPISVVFTLPESVVSDIIEAQARAPLSLQAQTGGRVLGEGKVAVIDNQIDQSTGTLKIKGTFPNDENRLWPGQFVNVKLRLKTLENAVVVPSAAVQQGANGAFVYRVTPEKTASIVSVKVVQEGEKDAVIGEGIAAGDVVVTSGFSNLRDGSKLKLAEDEAIGSPARNGGERKKGERGGKGADAAKPEGAGRP